MTPDEHERVALESVIREIQKTIDQAEAYGLDTVMPDDYVQLLDIFNVAIKSSATIR